MIVIVNYGIGNLDSVSRAFAKCGEDAVITSESSMVDRAEGIVLPGVGSFAPAMQNLRDTGLLPVLNRKALEERVPVLGICLGFQMFSRFSEEGDAEGLGWLDAVTRRFRFDGMVPAPKVPHLGWNDLQRVKDSPLIEGVTADAAFYFAHSYYVDCHEPDAVLTATGYGHDFVSSVACGNLYGLQFHPEKSHANGLRIVSNFIGLVQHA